MRSKVTNQSANSQPELDNETSESLSDWMSHQSASYPDCYFYKRSDDYKKINHMGWKQFPG